MDFKREYCRSTKAERAHRIYSCHGQTLFKHHKLQSKYLMLVYGNLFMHILTNSTVVHPPDNIHLKEARKKGKTFGLLLRLVSLLVFILVMLKHLTQTS